MRFQKEYVSCDLPILPDQLFFLTKSAYKHILNKIEFTSEKQTQYFFTQEKV